MRALWIACSLASAIGQAQITGPVSAVVFDEASHSVRAVLGVPGAAYFGPAVQEKLDGASVSRDGRYALLSRSGQTLVLEMDGSRERVLAEKGATAMAWSPASDAAAFVSEGELFLYTGIEFAVTRLGSAAGARALAVAPRGDSVFAAREGAIFRYRRGEEPLLVASVTEAASLAASEDGSLYVVDRAQRQVLVVGPDGGASTLAAEADPIAVGVAKGVILVADGTARTVSLYRAATRERIGGVELSFPPSALEPIGNGLFALNQRGAGQPLEVLALDPAATAYFIPALEVE